MKDPSSKHYGTDVDDFGPDLICAEDGKEWPCTTWRKWMKSKDYRIAELERLLAGLARELPQIQSSLSKLRAAVHRNELLTAAQTEWLAGLNQTTGHAAGIEVRCEVEGVDVTAFGAGLRSIAGARKTFEVRYGDGEWKS